MGNIDIEELIEVLPELIRTNERIKGAILAALSGVLPTSEDLHRLMDESAEKFNAILKEGQEEAKAARERFEKSKQRFDRIDEHLANNNQHLANNDQHLANIDEHLANIDEHLGKINERFDNLIADNDLAFEVSAMNFIARLENSDPKKFRIRSTFQDPKRVVFKDTTMIEIDIFNENPLIVGEVTIRLKSIAKLQKFLKKLALIEALCEKRAKRYFCFLKFKPSAEQPQSLEEIEQFAKDNDIILISGHIINASP